MFTGLMMEPWRQAALPESWHSLCPPVQVFAQLWPGGCCCWPSLFPQQWCREEPLLQPVGETKQKPEESCRGRQELVAAMFSCLLQCCSLLTWSEGYLVLEGSSRAGSSGGSLTLSALFGVEQTRARWLCLSPSSPKIPKCSMLLCELGYGMGLCWTPGVHRSGFLNSKPELESASSSHVSGAWPPAPVLAEPFAQGCWEGNSLLL